MFLDIQEVCQHVDREISQQPAETPTQVRKKVFFVPVLLVGLFVSFHSPLLGFFLFQGASLLVLHKSSAAEVHYF